jgi:hypothetical protein
VYFIRLKSGLKIAIKIELLSILQVGTTNYKMIFECPCCKQYNDTFVTTSYKKLRDEYAYKMAIDIVAPYAHTDALECTKKNYPTLDSMFNEHYLMYYRICYEGMFNVAVDTFQEHYIANAVEQFQGNIENTCPTFQHRYDQYRMTGCGLYKDGIYDRFHQPLYLELEAAIDASYRTNQTGQKNQTLTQQS